MDEEAYNKLLEEAPNYLYQLIPEGLKTYPINSEDSDESDLPDSNEDDSLDSGKGNTPESNESDLLSSDEDNLSDSNEINLLSSDEDILLDSEYENDEEDTDLSDINSEVEPILQS